jgi:hypothetical protein
MSDQREYEETSEKLDHTLQAYGRLERKHGELKRELARVREERDEARGKLDSAAPWTCEDCKRVWLRSELRVGVRCVICPDDNCKGLLSTPTARESQQRQRAERAEALAARYREALGGGDRR